MAVFKECIAVPVINNSYETFVDKLHLEKMFAVVLMSTLQKPSFELFVSRSESHAIIIGVKQ